MLNTLPRYLYAPDNNHVEETDIVIVGGGIAGLSAALRLSESNKRVLLVLKESFSDCNTYYAQGGIAAAFMDYDSPEKHFEDTQKAGCYFCNEKNLNILTANSKNAINFLLANDVSFDRDQNGFLLALEGGHSLKRIFRINGDCTGKGLIDALKVKLMELKNLKVSPHTYLVDILTEDNRITGVSLKIDKRLYTVFCKTVILATGGYGGIFLNSTNPYQTTGDGLAASFRAGAKLKDLEFIQFHPTTLSHPKAPGFLISEAVRGEGGILRNPHGERFMLKYHEKGELAPRDIVSQAIFTEMKQNNFKNVFLDVTKLSKEFLEKRFPQINTRLLECGIDISKDLIPIAPAAHYTIGGVVTGEDGSTSIEGLFAAGEVACTGVHGANRLASNSLLEGIVFGMCSAESALRYCDRCFYTHSPKAIVKNENLKADFNFNISLLTALKSNNSKYLGIIRSKQGLLKLVNLIKNNSFLYKSGFTSKGIWEYQNMLLLSYLAALSALKREESLGTHFRCDFPEENKFKMHFVLDRRSMEGMAVC